MISALSSFLLVQLIDFLPLPVYFWHYFPILAFCCLAFCLYSHLFGCFVSFSLVLSFCLLCLFSSFWHFQPFWHKEALCIFLPLNSCFLLLMFVSYWLSSLLSVSYCPSLFIITSFSLFFGNLVFLYTHFASHWLLLAIFCFSLRLFLFLPCICF